jgi:hypothetical protein
LYPKENLEYDQLPSLIRPTVRMPAQAVILERNKLVVRRMARVIGCAGYEVKTFEEPEKVEPPAVEQAQLVLADAFDRDLVMRWLTTNPLLRAILYTGEPTDRLLNQALEEPRLVALLGRANFETAPREDDLINVARRTLGGEPAPFEAHLAWGASGFAYQLVDGVGRDHAVNETVAFCGRLSAPKRVGEMLGELAHELVMNALYDAPVDEAGRPRFAHDRKAEIRLEEKDACLFRCASDGVRVAVEVTDHFGRLERKHVFSGLVRALKSGQLDTGGGGAGLGMMVAYRSTTALFFDVVPGVRTRVTGLFDLDLNLREFRLLPKTIHFPEGS